MDAISVKKLFDFKRIILITKLCHNNKERIRVEYNWNEKTYTVSIDECDNIYLECDDGRTLTMKILDSVSDSNNNMISARVYLDLSNSKYAFKPSIDVHGMIYDNKPIEDIKSGFDVTLRPTGDLMFSINECDGSNIAVSKEFYGGSLIFTETGVKYGNYILSNDGNSLISYKGASVPSMEEIKTLEKDENIDGINRKELTSISNFYKELFPNFQGVIQLRNKVLDGSIKNYTFSKMEMSLFYTILYTAMDTKKEQTTK